MRGASLVKAHPHRLRAFVGVHPSEAEREPDVGWLEAEVRRATGVGEIGLDPKYNAADRSAQVGLFRKQLAVAEKAKKPVQVHTRGAERESLDILSSFRLKAVLLHWFQGEELLGEANDSGSYVSFGPALLVSKKLQRMAASWDTTRLLVESDGPVSFSALGGASGPWLIPSVVFKLAEVLGRPNEDTARIVRDNTLAFLSEKA